MSGTSASLALVIDLGLDSDLEEAEQATLQLRSELLDLDLDSVERASAGEIPHGAKAIEAAVVGSLIIKFVESTGLSALAQVISGWLSRDKNRSIKIQMGGDVLELTGVSAADQSKLIEHWIIHHARG